MVKYVGIIFEEEEAKVILAAEKRKEAWELLENAASLQPITGNTAVLVTPLATSKDATIAGRASGFVFWQESNQSKMGVITR